jgi:ABC-type uncharacterized transport system permease subunit
MDGEFFLSVDRQVTAIAIVTAIVLVVTQLVRLRVASLLHRTVREAVRSNSPLAPRLLDKLDQKPTAESDSRTGLILVAVAVALLLFALIQGGFDWLRPFAGAAMFPAAIGAALLWRSRSSKGTAPDS